ncbi:MULTISPECIES: alpha/beta hydrolase [unclassified Roseitalea]|uniref:alpha/beta fold hydrolase n=1 Tax=unclassified Roseitalea TaxID=2639107 RepID=UPI00273F3FB2|nr:MULTISPECIES: alpha/beta hydrolase [unclassified Roseitalea]
MPRFSHDRLQLAYVDEGRRDAPAVLLIHGFASNGRVNWIEPGWMQALTDAGYRAIAIDNRGHGDSDKPHEPDAYRPQVMAADAIALLDALGLKRAHLFGYSMGARIAAFAALAHADRVDHLVFGGLGLGMVEGVGDWDPIADALLAPSLDDVTDARGRMFRAFADKTGSDRLALAACITASRTPLTPDQMGAIAAPTLIGVGTKDDLAGPPQPLAAMMPKAAALDIENRDHMLAVGDKTFKRAVLDFLGDRPQDPPRA